MTSRIASTLQRVGSLRRPNIDVLRDSIHIGTSNDSGYGSNEYIHKNFFDDENYRSIIKCLDGGYEISTDLIEYMQEYHDLLQDIIQRLKSYSTKWKSKLKHQPALSSYNTTKRAQLETVRSPEKLAELIQTRCDAILQVITAYKKQVNKMYLRERLSTVHKHYRADVMKKLFKNARSSLIKISEKLEKLREQEKKAQTTLLDAKIQCQNLELNETSSKSKVSRANDHRETKQRELQDIEEKIAQTKEEYNREEEIYRDKATEVYEQCRELEQERLDQIRETLLKFVQAIHSTEYSTKQDAIYGDLLVNIKSEQDTLGDLDFWADAYHVDISTKSISPATVENENIDSQTTTRKTKKSEKNDTASLTTISENTNQSIVEAEEEEQSVADKTTTQTKAKPKKKKNNSTEPTTPDAS